MTVSPRHLVEEFSALNTRSMGRLKEDQTVRERARDRWFVEMRIVTDCIRTLLQRSRGHYGGVELTKEMTNLLTEVMYLFDDNYADLTELFEFRGDMLSAMLLGMDKCVLDLRDIAEVALNEEHDAKKQLDLLHSELLRVREELSEKQQLLDNQSFRMNSELSRLEALVADIEAENDQLHRDNRKFSSDVSQLEKQVRKYYSQEDYIRSLEDKVDAAEKQNEDLIQINSELQKDKHALLDDNRHLVEEHNRILSDSKGSKDATDELHKRLKNVGASHSRQKPNSEERIKSWKKKKERSTI